MADDSGADGAAQASPAVPKNKKYRRDKPWDTDDIDHWKPLKFTEDDEKVLQPFLEESSFATLFPKYREKYLKEVWPQVTRALDKYGIACVLDLLEGSMTVKTTRKTRDPFILFKARDLIKLLARSVPVQQALKILEDEMACDIVKIGNVVRNKERFIKRRQRLIGPDGNTLKAIELLTGCYMLVQGNTVSCMGTHQGLKQVRRIILDCMNNIHPIYHIKELMIKRELAKDPALKNENWERFLPHFRKQNVASKPKKKEPIKKKEYTPFPPTQTPSKVDLEVESGEYFLKPEEKLARERQRRAEAQAAATENARREREKAFVAPREDAPKRRRTDDDDDGEAASSSGGGSGATSIEDLKRKFAAQAAARKRASDGNEAGESVDDYIEKKRSKKAKRE